MKTKTEKMPKDYVFLWLFFTAAYLVWTCFFLKWDTYPLSETGMLKFWYYPVWIVGSTLLMLSYILFIQKFLYSKESKAQSVFALVALLFGCTFITWYGFFKNPFEYTASMIGLDFPWHFKMWGIFAPSSIFINTLYMYRKYNYYSRIGLIAGSIGCAALFVTINVPSAGEDLILNSLRCMSHWSGALIFAFGAATPVVLFLLHMAKTKKLPFVLICVFFIVVLAVSLTLLATVGKDGIIEGIPTWSVYLVLLLINFTPWFKAPEDAKEKELVHA